MKGAGKDGVGIGDLHILDAVTQFPGRPVGEGYGSDSEGPDVTFSNQVGDAVGDYPGLAAAGPRHNKQRPLGGNDGLQLGIVQPGKDVVGINLGVS